MYAKNGSVLSHWLLRTIPLTMCIAQIRQHHFLTKQCVSKDNFVKMGNTVRNGILILMYKYGWFWRNMTVNIGKSVKPRCFAKVKLFSMDSVTNRKIWMTSELFKDWLRNLNRKWSSKIEKYSFLSTTALLMTLFQRCQMSMWISHCLILRANLSLNRDIQNYKIYYRSKGIEHVLTGIETTIPTVVDFLLVLKMIKMAWSYMKETTIRNCFKKCGFSLNSVELQNLMEENNENDVDELDTWSRFLNHLPVEEIVVSSEK